MTSPSEQQPREAGFFRAIREWGLTRGDNGFLGGVVDGLAQRVGMATGPARLIVVIAAIVLNGLMLLAYAAAWGLLPDRRGNIIIQNFGRGVPNVGALVGIAVLTLFGIGGLDGSGPFTSGVFRVGNLSFSEATPWTIVPVIASVLVSLAFVGGLVWFIIAMARRSQNPSPGQPAAAGGPRPAPAADAPTPSEAPTSPVGRDDVTAPTPAAQASHETPATPVYAAMPPRAAAASAPTPAPHASPAQPTSYHSAPPAKPRVPGPGRGFSLAGLAWIILSGAAVGLLDREDQLAVHPVVAWFVVMVTGLGVLLMIVSLAGRKLGFMGFMAIVLALPLPLITAGADELRDTYANDGGLVNINIGDVARQLDSLDANADSIDATTDFVDVYTEVLINGDCRNDATVPTNPASTTRLSFASLEADTSVDVVSQVTYVTISEGTDLNVVGRGDAQAHVVWPDRGITCDFWNARDQHLSLKNNVGPAVTLAVHDDAYSNTIVITEVSS